MRKVALVGSAALSIAVAVVTGCSSADTGDPALGTSQSDLRGGVSELDALNPLARHLPTRDGFAKSGAGGGSTSNLSYHGGGTITSAHVVACFWGPQWASGGASNSIAQSLAAFLGGGSGETGYGTSGEYNVITQYYSTVGGSQTNIAQSSLGGKAWYDASTPPTNVTDAAVQAEATSCMNGTGGYDASAIYEVFLPNGVYSSDGTSTSCGGPRLAYCAYHGHFTSGSEDIKYASMPYPSCAGCQSAGFTDTQNFEHFISHETREAVTDEDGNAWYDRRGNEADDKCAWSPAPFQSCSNGTNLDGSCFAYQYEWSNKAGGCVQTM